MRVYKATYKDRSGQQRKSAKWYVDIFDHNQLRHKIPAFADKQLCEGLGWEERKKTMLKCIFTIISIAYCMLASGCSEFDRTAVTSLQPIKCNDGYSCFIYRSFADTIYPLQSIKAEQTRIKWLEKWLRDNGYENKEYEITSRDAIMRKKGLLGSIYDIYYEVRVKESNKKVQ